jgi:CHAT domain-containing protein/tetratricopeptide (TPR) repeat protein
VVEPTVEIDNLNGLGAAHDDIGEFSEAQKYLQEALHKSDAANYVAGKARALLVLSNSQNYENHITAMNTAKEALALYESIGDEAGVGNALGRIGQYHLAQSNFNEAQRCYEEAIKIWRKRNLPVRQAGSLIMLAYIEQSRGAWGPAFSLLTQAQLLLDENAEPYKMGQIIGSQAYAYTELGLPEIGLEKAHAALEHFRRAKDPLAVIAEIAFIGKLYYNMGNYPQAISYLEQSIKEAQAANDDFDVYTNYEYLGQVYSAMGDGFRALQYLQPAMKFYEKAANPKEAARVRALIGQIYERQGDLSQAKAHYETALASFIKLSDRVNQSAIYFALGRVELRGSHFAEAEKLLRQSVEITEQMRTTSGGFDLTAAFSATVQERYGAYIECLMRQQRAEEAFEQNELSRARSLAELLRATQTNLAPGVEPELAEREKNLRQDLRVKNDAKVALLGRKYEKEELTALDNEIVRLEGEYKQATNDIKARYPAFAQISQPAAWGLRQIQEQVVKNDDTLLLEYSLGEERGYLWAVTRDGFASYQLPAGQEISQAADKLYKLLSQTPGAGGQFNEAARELSRLILAPAAAHLGKRRIIVVADGALNYIPFQVLTAPEGNEPLVARHEVVNAPSASVLGLIAQETAQRQPAEKVLAAFGDPVFRSNYLAKTQKDAPEQLAMKQSLDSERFYQTLRDVESDDYNPDQLRGLFYAGRELANLRALAPDALIAGEFDATRDRLQQTDLRQYRVLHFATHGLLNEKRPENSGLVMSLVNREGQAQEGFVSLSDIYNLRAPADLVVLSACRTGLGKDVRGEGLIGLTRGFMYAGAASVAASLWKVDDEAAAELMKEFYGRMLRDGKPPAEALREAQNAIRQRPEWSHPFYWAAFTMHGEYRRPIQPASRLTTPMKIALGGAAALLLLAGWAAWRRRRRGLA